MSTESRSPVPSSDRLREMVHDITDDSVALGPLDIDDIRTALLELLAWRDRPAQAVTP